MASIQYGHYPKIPMIQGRQAFLAGLPISSADHRTPTSRKFFRLGWLQAQREQRPLFQEKTCVPTPTE